MATAQVKSCFVLMRKVALLYNPASGRRGEGRLRLLESALQIFRGADVEAELVPTESPAEAGHATRQAIGSGCDTVFACGGDGTIHNIVQVLAYSRVVLGILPMGTANAVAHDLKLPMNVVAAAKAALHAVPRRIALGHVRYSDLQGNPAARHFIMTAGIGVDAHLFYKLLVNAKQRFGMAAYYAKAWHLWFNYSMTKFRADYFETASDQLKSAAVTELLSVRIRDFGGVIRELAPGASLYRNDMRLILCHTDSRLAYLAYVARGLLRSNWKIRGIDLVHASKVSCQYVEAMPDPKSRKIYVEADGELIGTLPAEITVVPDALTLLAPSR
jgi:diacylglycerol kinase (ATP)